MPYVWIAIYFFLNSTDVCCFCYNSFQNWCGSWWQWLFVKRTNPSLLCRVVWGCKIYLGFYVCGTGGNWWCWNNVVILMHVDVNLAILNVILQFYYHVNSLYLPDTPSCISTSRLISFSGNTECWKRHVAGEIGATGVRLVSSDHGLFHDLNRRWALILINPDTSLIGPLETKPKDIQKNFQKMKQILKCRLQCGSHFVSQQH